MKVRFNKSILSHALDTVQRAAQTKITSNTNNGILIRAAEGRISFEANDYTIGIKTSCEAEILEPGDVVVAAPQMPGMIKLLPGEEVILETDDAASLCHFRAGSAHYRFPTMSYDDFPQVEEMERVNVCHMACADLQKLNSLIAYAAAMEKNNPVFNGILFEIKGSVFSMSATNTHRLAIREITLPEEATSTGRFIVPSGILNYAVCFRTKKGHRWKFPGQRAMPPSLSETHISLPTLSAVNIRTYTEWCRPAPMWMPSSI